MSAQPRFNAVYVQYLSEMGLTFPELEKAADKAIKAASIEDYLRCVGPIRSQIAARDGSIFTDKGVEIAPGVVLTKKLWKEGGKSTQKAIWDFLSSLILLATGEARQTNTVDNDFAKFFDVSGADIDMKKMFKDLGEQFSKQSFSGFFDGFKEAAEGLKEKFGASMGISGETFVPPIPEKLFKGHIAKIAEELAREFTPADFGLSPDMLESNDTGAVFEYLQQIFSKNPDLLMKGAKKIASRIQEKLQKGQVRREELIQEAEELMKEFQNNPMFKSVFEQLGASLRTGGGSAGGPDSQSERRRAVQERLRKKMEEKKKKDAAKKE